jgi:transposase-like protein
MLSATRDMKAARTFFCSARSVIGFVSDRVITDGHSYPRAIRSHWAATSVTRRAST